MDRMTKVLLAAIALGLWTNVAVTGARAQQPFGFSNEPIVMLAHDIHAIATGSCQNTKLCSVLMP